MIEISLVQLIISFVIVAIAGMFCGYMTRKEQEKK